jgi:hypothetical protein
LGIQFLTNQEIDEESNETTIEDTNQEFQINYAKQKNFISTEIINFPSNNCNHSHPPQHLIHPTQYQRNVNHKIPPTISPVNQQLIEEIQKLQNENSILKKQLNQEIENRKEIEMELKKREELISIPPIFLPSQGRQAGNFFFFHKFDDNLTNTSFQPKNSTLTQISEQFALFFGRLPNYVIGQRMSSFIPQVKCFFFSLFSPFFFFIIIQLPESALQKKSIVYFFPNLFFFFKFICFLKRNF